MTKTRCSRIGAFLLSDLPFAGIRTGLLLGDCLDADDHESQFASLQPDYFFQRHSLTIPSLPVVTQWQMPSPRTRMLWGRWSARALKSRIEMDTSAKSTLMLESFAGVGEVSGCFSRVAFDVAALAARLCPRPPMQRLFRIRLSVAL
jgi:hypothetical protein